MDLQCVALMVALIAFTIGSAEPGNADPVQVPSVEPLKEMYIECEQRALSQLLPSGDIARCSEVYETLKLRAFGGDWIRLRDWFQNRSVADGQV